MNHFKQSAGAQPLSSTVSNKMNYLIKNFRFIPVKHFKQSAGAQPLS